MLKSLDVDLDLTRQEILKELDPNFQAAELPDKSRAKVESISSSLDEEAPQRFNEHAQQTLAFARREADRFNHQVIATEHLLLGLVKLGTGVAVGLAKMLAQRRAASYYTRSTGHLPPELQKDDQKA